MSEKKLTPIKYLGRLAKLLIGLPVVAFLITAVIMSIFGNSLWSWVNVLRFIIGEAIVFTIVVYVLGIKQLMNKYK